MDPKRSEHIIKSVELREGDSVRIHFPDHATFHVTKVERGILLIYAVWSGPAIMAWKSLLAAVRELAIDIFVIDTDDLADPLINEKLGTPIAQGGWGETFWIRNGLILHVLQTYRNVHSENLRAWTQSLLSGENFELKCRRPT